MSQGVSHGIEDIVDPTVNDDITKGIENQTDWTNTLTDFIFRLVDNTAGAAKWIQLSPNIIKYTWNILGALVVNTTQDGPRLVTQDQEIISVSVVRGLNGDGGSTIVDVNLDGTTIFTTQANRPTILNTDGDLFTYKADDIANPLPDIIDMDEGDSLDIDVDQVETGSGANAPQNLTIVVLAK